MPTDEIYRLEDLLAELQATAQPRPDLVPGGGRPTTFAGRVTMGGETPAQVLARVPTESPDAEGLGGAAIMAGFAPIATKAQKKIVKAMFRASPEVVEEIRQLPQQLKIDQKRVISSSGQAPSGAFRGSTNELTIDPSTMRGQIPQHPAFLSYIQQLAKAAGIPVQELLKTGKTMSAANLPRVAVHEGQHFLNKTKVIPKLAATSKEGPHAVASRIVEVLPPEDGLEQVVNMFRQNDPMGGVDEALAYLRELSTQSRNNPQVKALVNEFLK